MRRGPILKSEPLDMADQFLDGGLVSLRPGVTDPGRLQKAPVAESSLANPQVYALLHLEEDKGKMTIEHLLGLCPVPFGHMAADRPDRPDRHNR